MTEDHRIQEAGPSAPPAPDRRPLNRTEHHRVVAGVCGGLGRHLDIDPVVFRVVTVVLCLSGGLGLFLYGLAWLVVPTEPVPDGKGGSRAGRTELQRVLTGRVDGQSVGAVLLTVIGTGVFFSSMGDGDQFFPLLLLAALVFLAVRYDPERRRGRVRGRRRGREHRHGPYDRLLPEAEAEATVPGTPWTRPAEDEAIRERHARERAAGTVPVDTPHAGPTGYLWDPRHPERNPYGEAAAPPPGGAAQPWWQRTDLPQGDPLRKSGPAAPPRPPVVVHRRRHEHSPLSVIGLLLAAGAATAVWSASSRGHSVTVVSAAGLATALLVIGLTLLVGAKFGRARKLVVPGLLLTLALTFVGHSPTSMQNAAGERTWTVTTATELEERYSLGAGEMRLDLGGLDPAGATLATTVELGAGQLTVTLPRDVTVNLTARVLLGDVKAPGEPVSRENVTREYQYHPLNGQTSKGTLDLKLTVGLGDIKVVQS
ncbi:PspC domain-containing protein [Kitasatospora sp. A2-31]|uniref:PspC domain-containing protein n=1 Tax=Kitasatospora sp. A2-31 TaxID=2916414 RepID=UPI001EEBEEC4|nr:PspC domain-containing protein [Kitasatospora sp. A2-31]MCG6496505.1 PspC domain-containing protein [Kitasatospora sp. A2-31]